MSVAPVDRLRNATALTRLRTGALLLSL